MTTAVAQLGSGHISRHLEAEALHEPWRPRLRLLHRRRRPFLETERRHPPPVRRRSAGGVGGRRRRRQAPAGAVRPQGGAGDVVPPLTPAGAAAADGERQLQPVLLPRRRWRCRCVVRAGGEDVIVSGEVQAWVQGATRLPAAPGLTPPAADEFRRRPPQAAAHHQLLLDAVQPVQLVDLQEQNNHEN